MSVWKAIVAGGLLCALVAVPAAWAQRASSVLGSPCESAPLTLAPDDQGAHILFGRLTVASLFGSAGGDGCFAGMAPLAWPQMAPSDDETRPAAAGSVSAELQSGLLSHLDHAEDAGASPLRLGTVATLEAERHMIASLLEKVVNNLLPSDAEDPANENLNFTLNLDHLRVNPKTLLQGRGEFNVDDDLNLLLESLTITVSNGTITSETQLDPESLSIAREEFQINLDIGNATVSSITTFEKDQGVTKQVLNMTAWMGQLRLHSQVTLALDSREFRLGASISDLAITTISAVDLSGNTSQSFELEFNF